MQVFVRDHYSMIAAPVQCDVDGIPKGSHYAAVPTLEPRDGTTDDSNQGPREVASAARVADSSTREPSAAKIGRQPALPLEISGQQGTPCTQPLRQKYESFFLRERDWQSHSQPRIAAAHLEDFPRFQICFDILLRPPDRSHLFFRHKLCLILQVWRSFL